MLAGDPAAWLAQFRDVEQRLIEVLPIVWPRCVQGLRAQPHEDEITRRLVHHLKRNAIARNLGTIHSQHELLQEQRSGDVVVKGYIDMTIVIGPDADCYVAFECKRLNVTHRGRVASLAGPYVKHGMLRYVRAQYAHGLPLGAMIGYVLDGNLASAEARVRAAIDARAALLRATGGTTSMAPVASIRRFTTSHGRAGEVLPFEMRHALLAYPATT